MPYFPPASGGGGGGLPAMMNQSLPLKVRPNWYYAFPNTGIFGSVTMSANNAYLVPIAVPQAITGMTAKLSINLLTAAAVGSQVYGAIYKCDEAIQPTDLVADVGAVDAATTGIKQFGTPFPFDAAGYYALAVSPFTYTGIALQNVDSSGSGGTVPSHADPLGQPEPMSTCYQVGSTTAWATTFPAVVNTSRFAVRMSLQFKTVW